MTKDEILEKSRKENRNLDIEDLEIQSKGKSIAFGVSGLFCVVFFIINRIFGDYPFDLGAIYFSMYSALFFYKFLKRRKKHELFVAIFYTMITILAMALHIYGLIN